MGTKPAEPSSVEAERSALSCALIDPEFAWPVTATLAPSDFSDVHNRLCFEAMCSVYEAERSIDFITVMDMLENRDVPPITIQHLVGTFTYAPSSIRVQEYVDIVKDRARRRAIIGGLGPIVRAVNDTETSIEEVIELGVNTFTGQIPPEQGGASAEQGVVSVLAKTHYYYSNPIGQYETRGIDTGYPDLNLALDGWKRGNVYYVLGLEHSGKTTMAINFAMNVCNQGGRAAVFSLEQSVSTSEDPQQSTLWERILLSQAGVGSRAYQTGKLSDAQYTQILEAGDRMAAWDLTMYDNKRSIADIEATIQRLQREKPLDLVVVDYLKLIEQAGSFSTRNEALGNLTGRLKRTALRQVIPMIVPHQVSSKSIAQRQNKRIQLSDGYESGHISQDADVVMGLNRDELFNENTENPNIIDLDILKDRISGGTGQSVSLYFNKRTGLISSAQALGRPVDQAV